MCKSCRTCFMFYCTSPTISSHPPTSLLGSVYVPQTDTSSSYRAVDSTHTAVGHFRSLVRRSETRCLTNSEIRRVIVLTVLSSSLRQSCLVFTDVTSALEVFFLMLCAIYKSTFYFTLLTLLYCRRCVDTADATRRLPGLLT